VAEKRAAKKPNQEYESTRAITTAAQDNADDRKTGTKAGDVAGKTYYLDADGKVSTSPPERGTKLVAEGDVITEAIAEQLKK
jgi:hypothetical protein